MAVCWVSLCCKSGGSRGTLAGSYTLKGSRGSSSIWPVSRSGGVTWSGDGKSLPPSSGLVSFCELADDVAVDDASWPRLVTT